MRDLLRTKHFIVQLDDATHIVSRVRTAERFESVAQVEAHYDALVQAMDLVDRSQYAQLVDVRHAPPRNDAQFEDVVRRHHVALYRGFRANALRCNPSGSSESHLALERAWVSDVALGVGLVGLAAATYLIVSDGPSAPAPADASPPPPQAAKVDFTWMGRVGAGVRVIARGH